MRHLAGLAVFLTLSAGTAARADDTVHPVVVELFTSQGCSSCPPADAMLNELAGRADVIPLALHVDYWDYLGWTDEFADPAFTKRQKAYARVAGARSIYTPQMVVDGSEHLVGVRPMELADLIRAHGAKPSPVELTLTREGDGQVRINAVATGAFPDAAVVQLVRYRPSATVTIAQGENAGRTITYSNIVESWAPLGDWDGTADYQAVADLPGDAAAAVIVQEVGPGEILAAETLR